MLSTSLRTLVTACRSSAVVSIGSSRLKRSCSCCNCAVASSVLCWRLRGLRRKFSLDDTGKLTNAVLYATPAPSARALPPAWWLRTCPPARRCRCRSAPPPGSRAAPCPEQFRRNRYVPEEPRDGRYGCRRDRLRPMVVNTLCQPDVTGPSKFWMMATFSMLRKSGLA